MARLLRKHPFRPLLGAALLTAQAATAQIVVPDDFATIQEAIDAASAGATITVRPGTYTENITLPSDISVYGDEAARTFLRPDVPGPTVEIVAASDVVFAGFTLLDSRVGVLVEDGTNIVVANSIFEDATVAAVDADSISTLDVENNVFRSNVIAVRRLSADTHVRNNIFAENTEAVRNPVITNPVVNIEYNCFFRNVDLMQGQIDQGIGTNFTVGDPLFVSPANRDFHLRQGSPCIDAGTGQDVIDATTADTGAYGGPLADPIPYPVPLPTAADASPSPPPPYRIQLTWEPNLAYLVSSSTNPGGYLVHYRLNASGPPYDGTDAGAGSLPSPIDVGNVTTFTLEDLAPVASNAGPPNLTAAEPRNGAIALTWSAVQNAAAYRILYGVSAVSESQVDVGNVTSFTVTGLQNGVSYRFAVATITTPRYFFAVTVLDSTQAQNESAFSAEQALTIGPQSVSANSNELVATPEVTAPVPDLAGDGCFIATAAYSGESVPEVLALREFRDRHLKPHAAGRAFITAYYALSPTLARYLEAHPSFKPAVRAALAPFVAVALFLLAAGWGTKLLVAVLLGTLAAAALARPRPSRRTR
jgi:hypothetical protein